MALAKHENEDTFIAAQLQQTLADLDEDLEGRKVCVTSEAQKTETQPVDAKSGCTLGTSYMFLTEIMRNNSGVGSRRWFPQKWLLCFRSRYPLQAPTKYF